MVAKSFNRMGGSFRLSPIKRACGNVQPNAGGLRNLSEISRGGRGDGNFKFGFGN